MTKKISYNDCVSNEEAFKKVKDERNILHTI